MKLEDSVSVSFSSRDDTSISFVLNRSRGIGISRCSYRGEGLGERGHKYNLDSSDHMPLESRPFFFPGRKIYSSRVSILFCLRISGGEVFVDVY